jgi:Right handed beta helix region
VGEAIAGLRLGPLAGIERLGARPGHCAGAGESVPRTALAAIAAIMVLMLPGCGRSPEAQLRHQMATTVTGKIQLPAGILEVSSELALAPGAHDLEIAGAAGTVLKATAGFHGRAILVIEGAKKIHLRDFGLDGNRESAPKMLEMAPPENYFRLWYPDNGILADRVDGLEISGVNLAHVTNFPILVSRSSNIRIQKAEVKDSGSRNGQGRNNLSGGILIEEGSSGFTVEDCVFERIAGNGLWTHSLRISPRLSDGAFARNRFDVIGRDALQVGAATRMRVEDNQGTNIGYPAELVDVEHGGTPVAVDTAGNVDASEYAHNRFEEVNGKCFDLDGFHDGAVHDNVCSNRKPAADYPFGHFGIVMNNTDPDMHSVNIQISGNTISGMKFGGLFLIGSGHTVSGNRFLNLNTAGCNESAARFGCIYARDQPEMLESGIYLGRGAEHPADTRGNTIRDNTISGHGMNARCIEAAPGVALAANTIQGNMCSDSEPAR